MKANELMIGDWVIVYEKAMPVKAKVEGVHGNLATVLGHARIVDNGGNTPYVLPIHLNSDILEKNGFVSKKGRFMQLGNFDNPPLILWHLVDEPILGHPKNQLEIHHGAESIHVSFMCHYVHELQHALRLCKINKEIVL